ncbi:MAG TPA: PstS family phosphate ABC transporter substrate-binding protein, partial [candidate division Zixibacteria bacterium]|nr:PstS family phosphate ABC transporter substrate-binding protein [candidate division Zixibacteria bacterium]
GATDICAASRTIKSKELKLAEQKKITPVEIVVARDGIAVIVNPKNPVSELTIDQIGAIYTGAFTNWSQVGGPDKDIIVLSRESSSGTYVFFQEFVLKKQDYTPKARLMPATSAIVQSVTDDAWTIGYVGLGYAAEAGDKVKTLSVKADEKSAAIVPSEKTVATGEYAIARPLQLYTNGVAAGAVKAFIDFCLSEAGQKIVAETGYVPVGGSI